jgi:hypothetical protein
MTERTPLTATELDTLPIYSDLQESIVTFLMDYQGSLNLKATFELEDALLASLKPRASRSDFVELSMLASGVPHLVRAVENTWPNSRVIVDPFQNPESLGVSLSMIIHEDTASWPSIADTILDSNGKVIDPLSKEN